MNQEQPVTPELVVERINADGMADLSHIALACYAWSDYLINPLINLLRHSGFTGRFILGGYQINAETCKTLYPDADVYLIGKAEETLPTAILSDTIGGRQVLFQKALTNSSEEHSPYLSQAVDVELEQAMVHWETKRGCQFKCSFCQHRDLLSCNVQEIPIERVKRELDYFKQQRVQKINVLDPVFNSPKSNYLDVLDYCIEIGLDAEHNFQARFEFVTKEFLQKCNQLNVSLEFGLQTAIEAEYKVIGRPNNLEAVSQAIEQLHNFGLPYQVSLIYGLPLQTVSSFQASIDFLVDRGVQDIVAFPLMLLEGTELKRKAADYHIKERSLGVGDIPLVVSSSTFSEEEYLAMERIATILHCERSEVAT
jgi:radical SAM superfamily enzyme YgiQ (UPF0313 family)